MSAPVYIYTIKSGETTLAECASSRRGWDSGPSRSKDKNAFDQEIGAVLAIMMAPHCAGTQTEFTLDNITSIKANTGDVVLREEFPACLQLFIDRQAALISDEPPESSYYKEIQELIEIAKTLQTEFQKPAILKPAPSGDLSPPHPGG